MKATLVAIAVCWLPADAAAALFKARVVGIADGDTLTVLDEAHVEHRIRLMGIDAPEKSQAYGRVARQSLNDLAADRELTIEWSKYDRYGRVVGRLLAPDGRDLNLEQVRRGMAWHYKDYQREQSRSDRLLYAQAEDSARLDHRGLWSESAPTAPWDYRRAARWQRRNGHEARPRID